MSMKLKQFGVSDRFCMLAPVYLELSEGSIIRLDSASPDGNATVEQKVPEGIEAATQAGDDQLLQRCAVSELMRI